MVSAAFEKLLPFHPMSELIERVLLKARPSEGDRLNVINQFHDGETCAYSFTL